MTDGGMSAQWQFPSLVDYYNFDQEVLIEQPARLAALDDEGRAVALSTVQRAVAGQAGALDDEALPMTAVSVIDDLYKAGNIAVTWGQANRDYVGAVWGTFFAVLTDRGFALRYVVENTFPEPLDRPLVFFPDLFGAAGVLYLCPHEVATRLPEAGTAEHTLGGLRFLVEEARDMACGIVEEVAVARHGHLAYLEIDFDEGCLDRILGLPRAPGTISVFRNEAALPGSNVEVSIEARAS